MICKRLVTVLLAFALCIAAVSAADPILEQADALYTQDKLEEAKTMLLGALSSKTSASDKADVLWRLSRVVLNIGDELNAEGASKDTLFAIYEEAQSYAEQAIEIHPIAEAYQWKASSVGRWGETKGPLNALGKAEPMRKDLAVVINDFNDLDNSEAWYVMGQLYFQLPGWPISFGNLDAAISYTRKALDTIPGDEQFPGHYKALAQMLWKRNWSASKRNSEIAKIQKQWDKNANKPALDRHEYYEGANGSSTKPFYTNKALKEMSDREEALILVNYALSEYPKWPFHSRGDVRALEDLQKLLEEYR